jgi:serine/threonine-protein kinase
MPRAIMTPAMELDLRDRLQRALGGQYRLERELGRGGMGIVFEAFDTTLDRRVAVKVVHPELTRNDTIVRRFLGEARMIARLRHPGIVAVHAAGSDEGLLYYVMDQVDGESLRERLDREGKLPVAEARRIAADLASALDAAARAGLVHRDVKPENILLDRGTGRPRLADFGIARAIAGDPNPAEPRTGEGIALGTPAYMSPEQASGEDVDARSDVYSLGIVTYEMLNGAPPFTGPQRVVISRHLTDRPTPLEKVRPEVGASLSNAVMRALEKPVDERWQSGDAFRAALVGEQKVQASRRVRRRRLVVGAGVSAVLIAAMAFATSRKDGPPAGVNPRHSILVLPFTNTRADSATQWLAEGSVNMLTLALSQWNDLRVVGPERVHDLLEAGKIRDGGAIGLEQARRLARKAGVWTVVLGDFDRTGDSLHVTARVLDVGTGQQVDLARAEGRATEEVRPLFDELSTQLLDLTGAPREGRVRLAQATTRSVEAYRAYLAGDVALNHWDLPRAERHLNRAIEADTSFGLAYYKLAITRGWMHGGEDTLGSQAIARAEVHAGQLPAREQAMIQAYRMFTQGGFDEARAIYEALLAKDPEDVDAWYGLGDTWFHDDSVSLAERFTPSLRAFKRALALDPGYALAFDHVNFILGRAARARPQWILLPGDSIAMVADGTRRVDSAMVAGAVVRARNQSVALARGWANLQPEIPKAHGALLAALLAADDQAGAQAEVARFRAIAPGYPELPFDDARIRFASGDVPRAVYQLGASLDSLTMDDLASLHGIDAAERLALAANMFAYRGNVARAAKLIDLSNRVRFGDVGPGSAAASDRDLSTWRMLGELYAAVGAPASGMRRVWQNAADASRSVPEERRQRVIAAGGAAAVGLLTAPTPDESALSEMESLGAAPPVKEVRALMALEHDDAPAARKALAEPEVSSPEKEKAMVYYTVYRRPLAAQAYFLLGDYERALAVLDGFDSPDQLNSDQFDMRWGMVGRVRMLRGALLEKLGRPDDAREQYRLALEQWQQADPDLQVFVQEAQQKLAQLEGRS